MLYARGFADFNVFPVFVSTNTYKYKMIRHMKKMFFFCFSFQLENGVINRTYLKIKTKNK